MCGIAGIISSNPSLVTTDRLKKMTDAIAHRGPDGEGFWLNNENTVGFGNRRLAIIDLTDGGKQPMHFGNRYTIVYNGEIYNYLELKQTLQSKGYSFKSRSDTEVILACYDHYGNNCLSLFDGMFALAIFDNSKNTILFARDRFGEKPFFYVNDGKQFVFASEMKALWAAGIQKKIDHSQLLNYLALGQVKNACDNSKTFFEGVTSLAPATYIILQIPNGRIQTVSYWSLNKSEIQPPSEKYSIDKFHELFSTAIKRRLRSDVELGTSLSGGLDSTTVAAFVQTLKTPGIPLLTFSCIFPGFSQDESVYIKKVIDFFHLQNHQVNPGVGDMIRDFETLCYHQEEPFQSSSIYAQYRVFEAAKRSGIKVLLDGQGADEVLAGYYKYIHWHLQELIRKWHFKDAQKEKLKFINKGIEFEWGLKNFPAAFLPSMTARQLKKNEIQKILSNPYINKEYIRKFFAPESICKPVVSALNDILYFNTCHGGLEELLRYADRNAMAHGRELRLPFLFHEVVQFVFSLPSEYKIRNGWTKWLLRKTVENKIPNDITWRKEKIGFEPPQRAWMEHPAFNDYQHEAKKRLVQEKILMPEVLNKKNQPMEAHAADNFDWRYLVLGSLLK